MHKHTPDGRLKLMRPRLTDHEQGIHTFVIGHKLTHKRPRPKENRPLFYPLCIYNSTSIRSLNIKKVSSAILWVDNHNINWTLFADVCINVITLFKKFVDRFVLTDRCFVLPRIHSCPYPCCR